MKDSIKILVVEDHPLTQKTLKDTFESAFDGSDTECHIELAGSGEEALIKLENMATPDLVILDLNLPGISGADVLDRMTQDARFQAIPVFPYSSLWDDMFNKPFQSHLKIVQDWYVVEERRKKSGFFIAPVTPKFRGEEGISTIHPKIIVFVGSILIQQEKDLSLSFRMMLASAQKLLETRL